MRSCRTAAALLLAPLAATVIAAAPGDGKYVLRLENALLDGRAMGMHLGCVDGRFPQAWVTVPAESNQGLWADASALRLDNGRLRGTVTTRVDRVRYVYALDQLVPAGNGEARLEEASFTARQGLTEGHTAEGTAGGELLALALPAEETVLELQLGKIIHGPNDWTRRVWLTLHAAQGAVTKMTAAPDRKRGVRWQAAARSNDLALAEGRLTGSATLDFLTGRATNTYTFRLEAELRANVVSGTVHSRSPGRDDLSSPCFGTARAAGQLVPRLDHGVLRVVLTNAAPGGQSLELYLERRNGRSRAAVGVVPSAHNAVHGVNAAGLALRDNALSGTAAVLVRPAGWPGWRDVPTRCEFELRTRVGTNGIVSGRYRKAEKVEQRRGTVAGRRISWDTVRRRNALGAGADWPRWRGPYGNGSGPDRGREPVGSLPEARLAWRSEERTPDAWVWSNSRSPLISGGYSSPVVQSGRVYVAYYLPSGENVDTGRLAGVDVPAKWLLDADDVALCVDAATGRTVWKRVFAAEGINHNGNLSGPHMTPCVANGALYFVGSAGHLRCLDAADGARRWQVDLGPEALRLRALASEAREQGRLPGKMGGATLCGCPVVADGTVVCNDGTDGLVGFDAVTGRQLWGPITNCISRTGTPSVWRCEGVEYILAALDRMLCIEPRTGRVVWEVSENVSCQGALALAELEGVCYVVDGGLTCFRITPEGAEPAWDLGKRYHMHVTSPLIYRDHVYPWRGGPAVCVALKTGEVKGDAPFWSVRSCSSFAACDGRILRPHLYNQLLLYDADPADFRQLGDLWRAPSFADCTTPAMLDGRVFFRGKDCLFCFDLRRAAPQE